MRWGRRGAARGRRTGPPDEVPWWDPDDQAFAEVPVLHHRDLGRGWQPLSMVNNVERLDPHGDDPDSEAVRAARSTRRLTALDEGAAWRQRSDGGLVVARVEVFAAADVAVHRAAWQAHGARSLDAVWRQRWRERDREPGWIEARPIAADEVPPAVRGDGDADDLDWFAVEDHTDAARDDVVTAYEHLTLWSGRALVTLTVRHRLGTDVDPVVAGAVGAARRRAGVLSRRSGPARGSA